MVAPEKRMGRLPNEVVAHLEKLDQKLIYSMAACTLGNEEDSTQKNFDCGLELSH